jgi:hypothetical protein
VCDPSTQSTLWPLILADTLADLCRHNALYPLRAQVLSGHTRAHRVRQFSKLQPWQADIMILRCGSCPRAPTTAQALQRPAACRAPARPRCAGVTAQQQHRPLRSFWNKGRHSDNATQLHAVRADAPAAEVRCWIAPEAVALSDLPGSEIGVPQPSACEHMSLTRLCVLRRRISPF